MTNRKAGALRGDAPLSLGARTAGIRWALWACIGSAFLAAYILLSGPLGLVGRAPLVDRALSAIGMGPPGSAAGIVVVLILACAAAAVLGAFGIRALTRRQALLWEALAGETNGRAITGPDGGILYSNAAFTEIMADERGEVFAGLAQRADGADGTAPLETLKQVASAGGARESEFRVTVGDGSAKWLKIGVRPLPGAPGHTLWCIEDVSVSREIGQMMATERSKLLDFLDNAGVGFYTVDGDGVFEYCNRTLADWVGVPAESLVLDRRRLGEFVSGKGNERERPFSAFSPEFQGNHGQTTLRRRDGSEFEVDVIETVGGVSDSGALKARGVVRELGAAGDIGEVLAAAVHRSRKLFEDSPAGIAMFDHDGVVVDRNPVLRRIAAAGGDPSGRPVTDLVAPEDRARLDARLTEVARGNAGEEMIEVHLAGGEDRAAALHVAPVHDIRGAPIGGILHVFDITQYHRLEEQFTQSQKLQAVGQLAGGIAHDFNNLLTVMIGFCDLILQRHRPGEQTFADIMQIKQNANRAANLVRQLLAFSRRQTLQPKVLNITDVLAELSNLLRRLIGVDITLNVVHGRDLGLVKVDQVQLEQVIINLAVNARDAMKAAGGTLTITTANAETTEPVRRGADVMPPGRYVSISVKDTGTGINEEDIEHIFEPFFSTKEVGSGTGLGLSTVYGIVSQTGGFVQVESVEGEGTEFTIYLPLYDETEEESREPVAAESGATAPVPVQDLSGVGTVLLVEDEDPVRLFGARALRNKGYEVLEAKSGDGALEVLREADRPIDLVISDVVMPGLDGPGLVQEVRRHHPHMKVIFISGYAEDQFRESLEQDSEIHFLPKPFSLDQLAGKVKDVLGG